MPSENISLKSHLSLDSPANFFIFLSSDSRSVDVLSPYVLPYCSIALIIPLDVIYLLSVLSPIVFSHSILSNEDFRLGAFCPDMIGSVYASPSFQPQIETQQQTQQMVTMNYASTGLRVYGYRFFLNRRFSSDDIPDLSGKQAIVTGGTSGIGLETALQLAQHGADVIILGSSDVRGQEAIRKIKLKTGKSVQWVYLNLNSIKASKHAAEQIKSMVKKIDILVANAGVGNGTFMSEDGYEGVFACNRKFFKILTNVDIGHFAFVVPLIPLLTGPDVRVVVLSSVLHYSPKRIDYNSLKDVPPTKSQAWGDLFNDGQRRYKRSKFANLMFARGLSRRTGENVYVNAVHPGMIKTSIQDKIGPDMASFGIFAVLVNFFINFLFGTLGISIQDGALTQLYAATSPEIKSKNYRGQYFVPIAVRDRSSRAAESEKLQEELWRWSERAVHIS